jgi:hypothetical protein
MNETTKKASSNSLKARVPADAVEERLGTLSKPLLIEIVAYAPTAFYHCTHCEVVWKETGFSEGVHEEQLKSALPPDLLQDYQAVSDWAHHLLKTQCDRVVIQVIDAASMQGLWKSVRHGLKRYPAVLVGGQRFIGSDFTAAEAEIARRLEAALVST